MSIINIILDVLDMIGFNNVITTNINNIFVTLLYSWVQGIFYHCQVILQ